MKKNDVNIIIVTHNGINWIEKCLKSCRGFPVIVVDNASTDQTVFYIKKEFPETILLPQKKNLGFGQANNIGISYALNQGAKYVFLLNQDAYLNNETIEILISVHRKYPEYGVLSPIHLNGEGNKLDKNFSYYLNYDNNDKFYFDAINKSLSDIYRVPYVNAAAWLLPRKTMEIIGGFDPIFFHYGEDDNYCQRIELHGLKIGIVPKAFIQHDREGRKKQNIISLNEDYLNRKLRRFKAVHGNVNTFDIKSIDNELSKYPHSILKAFLRFQFRHANLLQKEYKMISKAKRDILKSIRLNKIKGPNYLNVN